MYSWILQHMHALCKLDIYIYIFTPSMNELVIITFAICLCLDEMGPATPSATDFGQIWHDIDFNFTNTYKYFKTNTNVPPNLRNLPPSFCIPHPCFYSTVLVVDRYFHGVTLRSAFRPLSNGIPSVLSTCPPHHLLHRRPELFNGEALEKVTV